jgi:hypothetical protein
MPYQILTRQNSGSYATLVGSATKAVAALDALRSAGHTDLLLRDLDGNDVDWTSLIDTGIEAWRLRGERTNGQSVVTPDRSTCASQTVSPNQFPPLHRETTA